MTAKVSQPMPEGAIRPPAPAAPPARKFTLVFVTPFTLDELQSKPLPKIDNIWLD